MITKLFSWAGSAGKSKLFIFGHD